MTRSEAIKVLRTESVEIGGNAVSVTRWLMALDMAVKALDAVPVVRCKDCARCITYKGIPFCNKWRTFPEVELDGFCSYGERKRGADNGS